jgi:hypothetical protein
MADDGLFIGFGRPIPGREREALQVFKDTLEYYTHLVEEGELESFVPVLLDAHGNELGGYIYLYGEYPKLAEVRQREEFLRLVIRAGLAVEHLGVVGAVTGDELTHRMALYEEQLTAFVT